MASDYVIASMCGCWKRESGVNPGIWESLTPCAWDYQYEYTSKGGYGLGQWTNVGTPHGRLYNLHTWVTSNGYSDGDGAGQIAFVKAEAHWTNSGQTRGSYTTLQEFLDSDSTSIDTLVWDFLANWEGVPGDNYDERVDAANKFYVYIQAHKNDNPESYTWYSANTYTSETQMLNNVMCIYFILKGESPGPTPTTYYPILKIRKKRRLGK